MSFRKLVEWLESIGAAPVVAHPFPGETDTEESLRDLAIALLEECLSPFGLPAANVAYIAMQAAWIRKRLPEGVMVWIIAQTGDEGCRIVRICCNKIPAADPGYQCLVEQTWEITAEDTVKEVKRRIEEKGYSFVRLPANVPLLLPLGL